MSSISNSFKYHNQVTQPPKFSLDGKQLLKICFKTGLTKLFYKQKKRITQQVNLLRKTDVLDTPPGKFYQDINQTCFLEFYCPSYSSGGLYMRRE